MENYDLYEWINNKIKIIRNSGCYRKILIRPKDINFSNIKKEK